ncbi:hypothetical protein D6D00_02287 [Aureobasidium pullulans]|nr:hypothetical protein D6D00_02287 [Aureobasidium pullulans]
MDIFTAASSESTVSPETLRSDLSSLLATVQHGAQDEQMVGTFEAGPYRMGPELLARSQFAQLISNCHSTDDQPVKLSKPTASTTTKKTKPLYNSRAKARDSKCRAALEKAIRASQSAKSLLLHLPKEIRTMVYELALWQDTEEPIDVVKDSRIWPALSGVSRQVRQESTEVFLRTNRFRLHTVNNPRYHVSLSSLGPRSDKWDSHLDYGTNQFLQKIETEGVTKLRRLSFAFGNREVQINLACLDASQWVEKARSSYERLPWRTLGEGLKFWQSKKQKYVGISMFDITDTRRLELCLYAIEETQKEIKAAQLAMNGFAELCGTTAMDDLLHLMEQATLSPGARRVDSKFAPTERSKDQITYEDFGIVTQLYPGRRSTRRLARALRQDDCSNNPHLEWSHQDILSALQNRQITISESDSESRFKCRLALELADKTATLRFLELPKEVRMLVYEQALLHQGVFKHDSHAPPALFQINQQVRQESREIFFSINCFRLRTRRCIIRRPNKTAKTHQTVRLHPYDLEWLQMIGSENVVRLRRLSFITPLGIDRGKGVQLDLSIPDVSKWARPVKCGCRECQTKAPWTVGQQIEKSDKKRKWLDSCC